MGGKACLESTGVLFFLAPVRYGVNLNASSAAPNYGAQYSYIRSPSAKKPLSEIDAEPYHSPTHPTGDALQVLLARSERTGNALRMRPRAAPGGGGPQAKRARLTFPEVADIIYAKQITTKNDLLSYAKHFRSEGDPRLAEYLGRQRSVADTLRKAQEYLLAKPGAPVGPGAVHSESPYPYASFRAPGAVTAWARDDNPEGYRLTSLILYGKSKAGKTQMAKALCAKKGWQYLFISSVDALRSAASILSDYALILDESDFRNKDPDWVKALLDVENDRTIQVRFENMYTKTIRKRVPDRRPLIVTEVETLFSKPRPCVTLKKKVSYPPV